MLAFIRELFSLVKASSSAFEKMGCFHDEDAARAFVDEARAHRAAKLAAMRVV